MARPQGSGVVLNATGIQTIRDLIAPKETVLMPVETFAKAPLENLQPEIEKQLPGSIWFQHELESRTF
jgi:hypothetical protein